MKTRTTHHGFSYVGVLIGVVVVAVGLTAIVLVRNAQKEQDQYMAAGVQRTAYATIQQEITSQGIDPTKIINPLVSVATPVEANFSTNKTAGVGTNGQSTSTTPVTVGSIGVATTLRNAGGSAVNLLQTNSTSGTGTRAGGLGEQVTTTGLTPDSVIPVQLEAPTIAVTLPLTVSSFPATNWFTLPTNPVGTVYRYTTDGSDPTDSSPVWNVTAAGAIDAANFPAEIRIAAFHPDTNRYLTSPVMTLSGVQMQLPAVAYARNSGGTSTIFTYSQMTAATPNGILLSPSASLDGVAYTIRYTVDGSDPRTSGSAASYSGNFVVPFANWTEAVPAVATVKAALVSADSRYVASTPATWTLNSQQEQLSAPSFSFSSGSGPVAEGTVLTFSHVLSSFGVVLTQYASWSDPVLGVSTIGWVTVIE